MTSSSAAAADLLARARRWRDRDPETETRAALSALIDAGDLDALGPLFATRLSFGTAGIRGQRGPGPARLNALVVRETAAGLARVLLREVGDAPTRGVVVGFDGRHGSAPYARDAACVLAAAGLPVFLFDQVAPTPLLAHAVRHLHCAAGVMVTASHNPPQDNGVKVYWGHGAQITDPVDGWIADAIAAVAAEALPPTCPDLADLQRSGAVRPVPAGQEDAYVHAVLDLRVRHATGAVAVYTAMHGVGYRLLARVLDAAGHTPVRAVAAQRDPDGDFPTVTLPNPEEDGAMDLALDLARASGADLVLANDPDADRLAVAVPDADSPGGFRQFSGNEVGLLLAEELLSQRRAAPTEAQPLVANTIVSSSLLGAIAAAHGAARAEVLTGFKWLADAAMKWEGPFVLGFEEALGYSAGEVVRDKDGISTALLVLDLASALKAEGRTLLDALDALCRRYGVAASSQRSLKLPGAEGQARIAALMATLRAAPPSTIAGREVLRIRDVKRGVAIDVRTGAETSLGLPSSNVLAFDLAGGCRVLARPSGTEPKLKIYFEAVEPVAKDEPVADARTRAEAVLAELEADMAARVG
ncbi:MAG: phospho-sugar mutase [Alphaproteobacteria bacterium]|nr:phospho-sugar mutase [Alphaproteobacteria bacterium]